MSHHNEAPPYSTNVAQRKTLSNCANTASGTFGVSRNGGVTSSPPYSRLRRSLRVGLPTKSVFAGLGTSGSYPVVIQGVPRPRYPYPLVRILEYLACFLTVSHSGQLDGDTVERPSGTPDIVSLHRAGGPPRLVSQTGCAPLTLPMTALYPRPARSRWSLAEGGVLAPVSSDKTMPARINHITGINDSTPAS